MKPYPGYISVGGKKLCSACSCSVVTSTETNKGKRVLEKIKLHTVKDCLQALSQKIDRVKETERQIIPDKLKPMDEYSNDDIIGLHAQAVSQYVLFGTPIWFEREHIFCKQLQKRMEK